MVDPSQNSEQKPYIDTEPSTNSKLVPANLVRFLELLRHNGNVSMSARMIKSSRTAIYTFANKNPDFKESMKEAMKEGRELLVGEGWRRATEWSEHVDSEGKMHITAPDNNMLRMLIQGYFQMFKPGRDTEPEVLDEILPESADLTVLDDTELQVLEKLLSKVGGKLNAVAAREG